VFATSDFSSQARRATAHAEGHTRELVEDVRIRVDRNRHAEIVCAPGLSVVQVETRRLRVDLDRLSVPPRRSEHAVDVDVHPRSGTEEAPARVREDVDVWVRQRAAHPTGHLGPRALERDLKDGPTDEASLS
jgi:hypothetical protein